MWTIESLTESLIAVTICAILFVPLELANRRESSEKSSVQLKKPPIK